MKMQVFSRNFSIYSFLYGIYSYRVFHLPLRERKKPPRLSLSETEAVRYALFVLSQALTRLLAGVLDRSLSGCQNYRALGIILLPPDTAQRFLLNWAASACDVFLFLLFSSHGWQTSNHLQSHNGARISVLRPAPVHPMQYRLTMNAWYYTIHLPSDWIGSSLRCTSCCPYKIHTDALP